VPLAAAPERLGATWSHSCGASLLSTTRALSAAHCVDGAAVAILRVIAGLHDRSNQAGAQISTLTGYTIHQQYNQGAETFNNDISLLFLTTPIVLGGNVALLRLPNDNSNQFSGLRCTMSGWGRTNASNNLPNILQKGVTTVLTTDDCNQRLAPVSGALSGPGQICLFDTVASVGSCNGDSGGPLNCDDGAGIVVAGVTSWGIQGGGACLPTYPSVYTRTSYFLAWISSNL